MSRDAQQFFDQVVAEPVETQLPLLVQYRSNNSGGGWWLKDQDWLALEQAGWTVYWAKDQCKHCYASSAEECAEWQTQESKGFYRPPHTYTPREDNRWLGALATSASKRFENIHDAIDEWERVTHQSARSMGCSCCGTPHSFTATNTVTGKTDYYSPSDSGYGSFDFD